jgi:hypothetical protein
LDVEDETRLADAYMLLHLVHTQAGLARTLGVRALALPILREASAT